MSPGWGDGVGARHTLSERLTAGGMQAGKQPSGTVNLFEERGWWMGYPKGRAKQH